MDMNKDSLEASGWNATVETKVENSCMDCGKEFGKDEIRVIPPRRMQERDRYVQAKLVKRRMLCMKCYNTGCADSSMKLQTEKINIARLLSSTHG